MKMRLLTALCFTLPLFVSACGVKPSNVEKPEHKKDVTYPRTYPDPSTDPRP